MFVLATFSDTVKVDPSQFRKDPLVAIREEINRKYANRIVQDVGLCIAVYDLLEVDDGLIYHSVGSLNYDTQFRLVVFRPYTGEVLLGKVRSCTEKGLKISLDFFDDIWVPPALLPPQSQFDQTEQVWVWKYDGNSLYMDPGEKIRVRVIAESFVEAAPETPKKEPADVTPVTLPLSKEQSDLQTPSPTYSLTFHLGSVWGWGVLLWTTNWSPILATDGASPPIKTTLEAGFPAPPLVLEMAEYLASESQAAYYPFLTHFTQPQWRQKTPRSLYEAALEFVRKEHLLDTDADVALMKWALTLHVAAPAVEAYYQYYRDTVVSDMAQTDPEFDNECSVWVLYQNKQFCTRAALQQALPKPSGEAVDTITIPVTPKRLPFDHVYPPREDATTLTEPHGSVFILYGDVAHETFYDWHTFLIKTVDQLSATYIFRPRPAVTDSVTDPLVLSGYGVTLRLKNTDYLVVDDRQVANDQAAGETGATADTSLPTGEYLPTLEEESATIQSLTAEEIAPLGLRAAQYLVNVTKEAHPEHSPLTLLSRLSQNFPKLSHILSDRHHSTDVVNEAKKILRSGVKQGLWLNGQAMPHSAIKSLDPFKVLEILQRESRLVRSLRALDISPLKIHQLLLSSALHPPSDPQKNMFMQMGHRDSSDTQTINPLVAQRVDPYAAALEEAVPVYDLRDSQLNYPVLVWWNDLEKDSVYSQWPTLDILYRAVYSRGMVRIRKNLCSAVFFLDLTTLQGLEILVEDVAVNVYREVPLRFGIIPMVPDPWSGDTSSEAETIARLFFYLTEAYPKWTVGKYFLKVMEEKRQDSDTPLVDIARRQFESFVQKDPPKPVNVHKGSDTVFKVTFDQVIASGTKYDDYFPEIWQLQQRFGLIPGEPGATGAVFINGKYSDLSEGYRTRIMEVYQEDKVRLAYQFFEGGIAEDTDLYEHLLTQPGVLSERTSLVFPTGAQPVVVHNVMAGSSAHPNQWADNLMYFYPWVTNSQVVDKDAPARAVLPWVSLWLVGDLRDRTTRRTLYQMFRMMNTDPVVRVGWIPNPNYAESWSQSVPTAEDAAYLAVLHNAARLSTEQLTWTRFNTTADLGVSDRKQVEKMAEVIQDQFYALVEFFLEHPTLGKDDIQSELTTYLKEAGLTPLENEAMYVQVYEWFHAEISMKDQIAVAQRLTQSAQGVLQLDDTATKVVVHGRVLPSITPTQQLSVDSGILLVSYELKERINPALNALTEIGRIGDPVSWDQYRQQANLVLKTGSALYSTVFGPGVNVEGSTGKQFERTAIDKVLPKGVLHLTAGKKVNAWFRWVAVLDPVSELAQKWSPLLEVLAQLPGTFIQVYLRPSLRLEELPLTQFYRYVLSAEPQFDSETDSVQSPAAVFRDLPLEPLMTLAIDAPSAWMVTPVASQQDLDNIRLATLVSQGLGSTGSHLSGMEAIFQLKHIMIEGHCQDLTTGYPPRGLQLVLGTPTNSSLTDTIIMANYGYFQFQANPGVWNLQLRHGRSDRLFTLESSGNRGWHGEALRDIRSEVLITSFQGVTIYPRVRRRPGYERENLLAPEAEGGSQGSTTATPAATTDPADKSPWGAWLGSAKDKLVDLGHQFWGTSHSSVVHTNKTINVFSVASGHLYERFLAIMIVSVLRHTQNPVKFWFIENFLSPTFKQFLPVLAQHYGFDYQLVTYQWPYWLRTQQEKQRTIWGYKILFLDVLFPLDVDRVIFVDADQMIRADLAELLHLDLQGAPYGYVPFCDNRPEMDGFRFWKSGWWADHLAGKPYHISALYVVDLARFRYVAAGDRLRQHYQVLSQDPNSLANLDQDLPNNMQHEVPIYSLPQDWLWCETWCSDASLKKAKSIDLCNNPLTGEPKLKRAKRLLPEWESYDEEIQALQSPKLSSDSSPDTESAVEYKESDTVTSTAHDEL
ncbi:killer toxin resistant protein [Dispira parvispora]|uniref:Killer toxin resistant protein n=1 Tax=Dispira parvispora TaxID=1520584 RepID=A0A9W8E474_9FUNG|nr:killer toxin resistant protein [Dispira parvispora]